MELIEISTESDVVTVELTLQAMHCVTCQYAHGPVSRSSQCCVTRISVLLSCGDRIDHQELCGFGSKFVGNECKVARSSVQPRMKTKSIN